MQKIEVLNVSPQELAEMIAKAIIKETPQRVEGGEEIMTREQVVKMLGITYQTLHKHVNKGMIKRYKLVGRTYFKRSEIMRVLTNSAR